MSNNLATNPSKVLLPLLGSQLSYNYQPLLSGDKFPSFVLNRGSFITIKDKDLFGQPFTSLQDILDYPQPLVLAFLSVKDRIVDIGSWKSFQADIEIMGGRLLIVTNGDSKQFTSKTRKEAQLNIWQDKHQQLVEDARLYDVQNPISDWLSGVDDDIPLPAFYIVGRDSNILFHHIDYALKTVDGKNFSDSPFVRNLLTSVYQSSAARSAPLRKAIS